MRKRNIHQSTHPFDECPFEAFYCGSWKNVKRLRIRAGAVSVMLVDDGDVFEENFHISNLRIKSRKAISSDCTCYLRPGLDVCVLSTFQLTQGSSQEENVEPVWLDAKINYVERKPHEPKCACQFYVSFYLTQGPLGLMMKALNKDIIKVQIDQISIIQMLERNPCDNEHYRWDFSQDCSSLQKYKFLSGKFSSDLSWLLVASVVKKIEFNVGSIQNKIVYQILDNDCNQHPSNLKGNSNAVNFKLQNGVSVPTVVPFTQTDILEKGTGCDVHDDESLSFYELMGLRRSKRRHIQPERFLACDLSNLDIYAGRMGTYRTYRQEYEETPLELPTQADHASYLDEHSEGYKKVHSHVKDYLENFFGCQSKIKSRELESAVSRRREHQPQLADQREHQFQQPIIPVLDGTDLMVKSAERSRREHRLQLANQNKQQSQPPIVPVLDETNSMVKSAEPSRREHHPQLANQRKHQSQRDILPVLDETDQMDHEKDLDSQIPGNSGEIGETVSDDVSINGIPIQHRKNTFDESEWERKRSLKKFPRKRDCSIFSEWGGFGAAGTNGKRTFGSSTYKEMIRRCMHSIKSTIGKEQPLVIDQWNKIRVANYLNERDSIGISSVDEEENSEIGILWKEMELCVASTYILEDSEGSNAEVPLEAAQNTSKHCGLVCQHEYKLNEEIGILCQLCGSVGTEIKYVSPTFFPRMSWIPNKWPNSEEDSEHKMDEGDLFCIPGASGTPLSEGEDNVWALIPDFKRKLRFHQKRAFEFLWRNIAGSLVPTLMESTVKKRGGCVISHSPGAGKTLLIIAFLVSYLELFPGSRPLVLAPKSTLYTWYKETIKWEIPIPVYQIHGGSTYKSEVSRQKLRASPGDLKPNQNFMHVLDCLNKIQKWLEHPSVLIMGYTSFLAMTRECSKLDHSQYMARVLQQSPGILILDEGHNPRNTTSRLRKGLMKVETRLRILLSGTLFQNNFGEYFNTLTLARPSFVNEVLRELDPKFKRRKADAKTSFSHENRARKLFVDKIAKKIDSSIAEERVQSLNVLRNLTSGFIDVYEGGSSENLPGLQCYTLMMKSTPYQQKLLKKLQDQRSRYKGFPLELELLITLGAIHPWLVRTAPCANRFLSKEELKILDEHKFDLKFSSKVRFVMNLLPRCLIRNEKVLVFCHNISPINLFLEMFESFYGWRKGEEVLVLRGDVELFERGRVMDKFEEPGGASKIMLASIRACAEGISLTAASRVILLDSEWNPSKTKQAIARAFRPGQAKVVYVYQLLAAGTLEEEKYGKTTWKEWVSSMMFSEEEEHVEDPSHCQAEKIEDDVLREIVEEDRATLFHKIMKIEKASSNGVARK